MPEAEGIAEESLALPDEMRLDSPLETNEAEGIAEADMNPELKADDAPELIADDTPEFKPEEIPMLAEDARTPKTSISLRPMFPVEPETAAILKRRLEAMTGLILIGVAVPLLPS